MIRLNNLSVGYGDKAIIEDISYSFNKGELVSIVGRNGCGKTTLLKTLLGILPKQKGEIFINDTEIDALSVKERARIISYLPQGKTTPDMTVEQMVLHGRFAHLSYPRRYRKIDREIAENAMRTTGVFEYRLLDLKALSGGMRQNAYIAMALSSSTDYILFDEPTTYLDLPSQIEFMKSIKRLCQQSKGVITVMHDLALALNYSDKMLVISGGKPIAFDSPLKIFESGILDEVFSVKVEKNEGDQGYYINLCD